jgi:predicted permease
MREPIRAMTIVVMIVMLVACANVASLLLARSRTRAREIAVRVAIGAPRRRVIRQLFTEGALLAVIGCGLGIVAARWIAMALMPALADEPTARLAGGVDLRLVPFAVLLAGGCAVLFALAPALRATDLSIAAGLQEAGRTPAAVRHRGALSATLVVVQIALSMVLVATAALLVRSAWKLQRVELGFDARNILLFEVDPTLNGYDAPRVHALYTEMLERLRSTPGVRNATLTNHTLISSSSSIGMTSRSDESIPERGAEFSPAFARSHRTWRLSVDRAFFATMDIRILRGRGFTDADIQGGAPPAVINQTLARRLFGTEDVVGRQFRMGLDRAQPLAEVVGVAADARYTSVREAIPPTVYLVYQRQPPGHATIEVRTSGDPLEFAPTAREIVRQVDAALPVFSVQTQAEQVTRSLDRERLFSRLATLLGLVTLGLAMIGLYALLAYAVTRRTPEIGVRMALGADGSSVRWMIMKQSLIMTSAGLAIGLAGAAAATKTVSSLLYGLTARDPVTMIAAAAGMITVSALAGYLPARRASRVDPIAALRTE